MARRCFPILAATLLLAASGASARIARLPLDPATLGGPDIFAAAETRLAQAAKTAGLAFVPDPRPLPPQVILTLDTAQATVQKRNGLLLWRGDMLPDQLAPAETGTLLRKRRQPDGTWKTTRLRADYAPAAHLDLIAVARRTAHFALPPMVIETPYQLGTLGDAPVALVLDAPLGAGASDERPFPLLRSVVLLSSFQPAALPVRRLLLAPQRLAARLIRPGPTIRPAGAATGGARSPSPSRMPG